MAKTPVKDDAVIEVEDEGVVTVDVTDDPALAAQETDPDPKGVEELEPEPAPKPPKRVRLSEASKPATDEATAALNETLKRANADRDAALATAETERTGRAAAEQRAAQQQAAADAAREQLEDRELTIITNGIEAATRELDGLEQEMARHQESADFAKIAAVTAKMSRVGARLDRLEADKTAYEGGQRKAAPTTEGRVEAPVQQPTATNVLDQYLALNRFAPAAQAWLRAHPECAPASVGGDDTANAKMMQGHYAAKTQGITPNTPDYFRIIEEYTGYRTAPEAEAEADLAPEPAAKPKAKPQAQPSAPVSRDPLSANGIPRTTRSVTLSRDQQEAARMSFPNLTPQQAYATYARNLIELEAEGKIGRLTH